MRKHLLRLHRWAGLATAAFLVLAGLTGSLLAFEDPLEAWLNPSLFVVAPQAVPMRDAFELRELAQRAAPPQARIDSVILAPQPARALRFILEARTDPLADPLTGQLTGQPMPLDVDELFMNPYTGEVLGTRLWGRSLFERKTAVSFIYRLHYALALPAPWSARVLGAVALLWTFNCLAGFFLTLPRQGPAGWWRRWRAAWRLAPRGSAARWSFSLHRSSGLWLWPVLLVFAASAVMLTLRDSVYRPVMSLVTVTQDAWAGLPAKPFDPSQPLLEWRAAHAAAREAMAAAAKDKGFTVIAQRDLRLDRSRGLYAYRVRASLDIRDAAGSTTVLIDASTGALRGFVGGASGNALEEWLGALHMARVFGMPYKVLVALLGLAVAVLSVTGVWVWARRRGAVRVRRRAPRAPSAPGTPTASDRGCG